MVTQELLCMPSILAGTAMDFFGSILFRLLTSAIESMSWWPESTLIFELQLLILYSAWISYIAAERMLYF